MIFSIYDLIFLLSSDCFSPYLFEKPHRPSMEEIRRIARETSLAIMADGDCYFETADFSAEGVAGVQQRFLAQLETSIDDTAAIKKIKRLIRILENVDEQRTLAENFLASTCAHLYWLNTACLTQALDDILLGIAAKVEPVGLTTPATHSLDWSAIKVLWQNARSEWDGYLKSITAEVPDGLCSAFKHLLEDGQALDFIHHWQQVLNSDERRYLIAFLSREGEQGLAINPRARDEYRAMIHAL